VGTVSARTSSTWRCTLQRYGGVLIWIPILLLGPIFSLPDGGAPRATAVSVIALMAVASAVAMLAPGPSTALRPWALIALVVLAAAVAASTLFSQGWLPVWVLLAITTPGVLRGWWLLVALAFVMAGSLLATASFTADITTLQVQGFVVSLAGAATTSFLRLTETVEDLRRTRQELARVAVVAERERFARDLHDLLGHTLSVMVVKSQAVRRLVRTDPDSAAQHAADIETVGRAALVEVREAVDAMRTPTLADELAGAKRALEAAGIDARVPEPRLDLTEETDEALAWSVREGVTNVLRHSGASHCRIELANGAADEVRLVVADDGVGGPTPDPARSGGLDGLRRRVASAGGDLTAGPDERGYRMVVTIDRDQP
jgi:two-component system sensor histidine kinase DesK